MNDTTPIPLRMEDIPSWGIIGASFESGALNWYTADGSIGRTDDYPCSWGKILQRRRGITDVYNFSNGSQTTMGWVLGSTATHVFTGEGKQPHPHFDHVYGVGKGGGGWNCAKENLKQAYVVVLGSNDINTLMHHDPSYHAGNIASDCGTYHPESDSDTKPDGTPGIVHSYAGYLCALVQRLSALNPHALIFLSTIRRQFIQDATPKDTWNAFNEVVRSIPTKFANTYVIDYANEGPNYDDPTFQESCWEIRHPNKRGYEIAADCYGALIDQALEARARDM